MLIEVFLYRLSVAVFQLNHYQSRPDMGFLLLLAPESFAEAALSDASTMLPPGKTVTNITPAVASALATLAAAHEAGNSAALTAFLSVTARFPQVFVGRWRGTPRKQPPPSPGSPPRFSLLSKSVPNPCSKPQPFTSQFQTHRNEQT